MNKTAIALAISGLALASVAQAAPQQNTFYVGAKAGWMSAHDGLKQLDSSDGGKYGLNRNSVTYGLFAGYQIFNQDNLGLAVEAGYDYFGRVRGLELQKTGNEKETLKHAAHGAHFSLKPSVDLGIIDSSLAGLDFYGRAGVALVNNHYKNVDLDTHVAYRTHTFRTSAVFAAGFEYAIPATDLALRLEWQWLNNVGKPSYKALERMGVTDYRPDFQSVTLGLSYRFGQGHVAAPEVIAKNFAFSSDVLFDFGKANLKAGATAAIDNVHAEIVNLGLASPAVQVAGYTDRIGTDASNLKLSQRRAETVANYIVAKGVDANTVTAVGYGEANPVTGTTCDAVKGRKALIACLAPDRRVEVSVQGSKDVTM